MLAALALLSLIATSVVVQGASIKQRAYAGQCPTLFSCGLSPFTNGFTSIFGLGYLCAYQAGPSGIAASCYFDYDGNLTSGKPVGLPDSSPVCPANYQGPHLCGETPTPTPDPPVTDPPPVTSTARRIHPNGNFQKCLDVKGDIRQNGTPVQIYDCNRTPAQNWVWTEGSTSIKLEGTNFCLDAGTDPRSGVGMKIWTCYGGLPAQKWYRTADKRFAVEGKGQCLDLTDGKLANGVQSQTWKCGDGNLNQVWTDYY